MLPTELWPQRGYHREIRGMMRKKLLERHKICFVFFVQAEHTPIVSHSQLANHLIMPRFLMLASPLWLESTVKKKARSSELCCTIRSASHSHCSLSHDRVFLTGYKCRQTHRGRNCAVLIQFRCAY